MNNIKLIKKMDKFTNTPTEIDTYVEILNKQLYFAVLKGKTNVKLKNNTDAFFFSIDDELVYENYYNDFGPLNISCLYKYCCKLKKYLQYAKGLKSVVHYTCNHPEKKANAACLMGLFCVIYLNSNPKDVWKILQALGPYKSYSDASQCPCGFTLKINDCLQAIVKALTFNFFNFDDFNVTEYDLYDKLQYGDMNWLLPRKFLAFIGPTDNNRMGHPPEHYLKYFLKNDVKTVIRLNAIFYDAAVFTHVGIQHFDLIFPDGTTPPKEILLKFFTIAEMAPAAIAVHCKAGLGRTGSLIGAFLIKHYHMTAREAIAWMRLCRPGSVIGQQQIWLEKLENWLLRMGNEYRVKKYGAGDKIPRHKYGIYSRAWPIERQKIITAAKRKIQTKFTRPQLGKATKQKKLSGCMDLVSKSLNKKIPENQNLSYNSVSKLSPSVYGIEQNQSAISAIDNRFPVLKTLQPKILMYPKLESDRNDLTFKTAKDNYSNKKDYASTKKQSIRNLDTQGDKLNEIKAAWLNERITSKKLYDRALEMYSLKDTYVT